MYTIKLMNEYLHGPIWVYDEEEYKKASAEMNKIITEIIEELQSINNNDFIIENYITKE